MKRAPDERRRPKNALFDLVAPLWDRLAGRFALGRVARRLELAPGVRVLDLAGATGRIPRRLDAQGVRFVVADLSLPMARRAARTGIRALGARAEQLPFAAASFDRVLVVDALHHFADIGGALNELRRVLAPGGFALLFEPDPDTLLGLLVRHGERLAGMGSLLLDAAQLAEAAREAGFSSFIEREAFHLAVRLTPRSVDRG